MYTIGEGSLLQALSLGDGQDSAPLTAEGKGGLLQALGLGDGQEGGTFFAAQGLAASAAEQLMQRRSLPEAIAGLQLQVTQK